VALQFGNASRPQAQLETVLCAAPRYLDRHGRSETIADLARQRRLGGIDEVADRVMPWRLKRGRHSVAYRPAFNLVTHSIDVLVSMALAGCGFVHLPCYLAVEPMRQGRLQLVLPRQELKRIGVQIIHARTRALVMRLREVIDSHQSGYLRRRAVTGT
jgi:LysR family transcriptional regulator, regulator for bpeEF and oprC